MLPHCPTLLSLFSVVFLLLTLGKIYDDDDDDDLHLALLIVTGWLLCITNSGDLERNQKS